VTIRAVLVDVGGVLVVPHHEPVVAALATARVRLHGPDFERAHFFATASVDRGVQASGSEPPYIQAYAAALGIRPMERERAVAAISELFAGPACTVWRRPLRESVEGLRRLAERPLPVGIVSNADGTVEELLLRTGICQLGSGVGTEVAVIVDSALVGFSKPDPRIFTPAIQALELFADEIIFVGDSYRSDVLGAVAAGLVPIHFDPYHLCPEPDGHCHITALDELQLA
jgi:putative hydrolase of the HAD superfamily